MNQVVIKSFPNGILLRLQADCPFEEILAETADKFAAGRAFFGDAAVALRIEGRELNDEEEDALLSTIVNNSDLTIPAICAVDDATDRIFVHALLNSNSVKKAGEDHAHPNVMIHQGSVTNGKVIESSDHILVLGDVYPGCAVVSGKSILVMGGLYGQAVAGDPANQSPEEQLNDHFVAALQMNYEKMIIDQVKAPNAEKAKWGILNKQVPKIAYVESTGVVAKAVQKDSFVDFIL